MRDEQYERSITEQRSDRHSDVIKELAVMSLLAAKSRQEERWPCLVRPVGKPSVQKQRARA